MKWQWHDLHADTDSKILQNVRIYQYIDVVVVADTTAAAPGTNDHLIERIFGRMFREKMIRSLIDRLDNNHISLA